MGTGPNSDAPSTSKDCPLSCRKRGLHRKIQKMGPVPIFYRANFLANIIHSKFSLGQPWLDREGNCQFLFR